MSNIVEAPYLVALNLTRRCNLRCAHCYLDAGTRAGGDPDEITTGEVTAMLDDIAALSDETMVVLTGGEPLMRPDIMDIARHAAGLGLMVVMGTNGTLLDQARVAALVEAGVQAVGVSVDSLRPDHHDGFRGYDGAWEKTMAGLDACRRAGLMFQIHFTVTDDNAHEFDDMVAFARAAGAAVLNVFFLVCTGRGQHVSNISAEVYENVLRQVVEAARDEGGLMVRARCAPHFKRMALEADPPLPLTRADGYDAGGCLAGTHYCRITPEGEMTPCPYMEVSAGSIRERGFAEIWRDAPVLAALRAPTLEGRCGECEYGVLCGGCRARPLARSGNLMGEDFLCQYQPQGNEIIEFTRRAADDLAWTDEARARIDRVPSFVRRFVRQRAETYAREQGEAEVTAEHLQTLMRRRFGDSGPPGMRPRSVREGGS